MARLDKLREFLFTLLIAINFGLVAYHGSTYIQCEEPELGFFSKVLVYLQLMSVQSQCPTWGTAVWAFLLDFVRELWTLVVLAAAVKLSVWIYNHAAAMVISWRPVFIGIDIAISGFCALALMMKHKMKVDNISECRKFHKLRGRSSAAGTKKYSYVLYKNAYAQRKEVFVERTSDTDRAIFKLDPKTKRFRCVFWCPAEEDGF